MGGIFSTAAAAGTMKKSSPFSHTQAYTIKMESLQVSGYEEDEVEVRQEEDSLRGLGKTSSQVNDSMKMRIARQIKAFRATCTPPPPPTCLLPPPAPLLSRLGSCAHFEAAYGHEWSRTASLRA
jgi:hypothetical protein